MTELSGDVIKFVLIFVRILAVLFMIPLFSLRQISFLFKGSFSILLAYLAYSSINLHYSLSQPLFVSIFHEALLGFAIGFIVRVIFGCLNMAGEIISLQSGLAFSRFLDPYTMDQTSIIVQLKYLLATLIFFSIDGDHIIIKTLHKSFFVLPLGAFSVNGMVCDYLIRMVGVIFFMALKIGSPIIVSLFLIEFSLGMLSRLIPQINVFIEGIPVKILTTISIFSLSLGLIVPFIASLFLSLEERFDALFGLSG